MDRIIGNDYWMAFVHLDYWILGFLFPNMGSVVALASQGLLFYCYTPAWALLSQLPRRGVFCFFLHPSLGDVVADASQGRFFFFCWQSAPKGHYLSTQIISGPDSFEK